MGCVIVLGLPRSGTSAVAGAVHRLGVNMGDDLMPGFEVNPKGFYEDMPFVNLHNQLLGEHNEDPEERFLANPAHPAWKKYAALIQGKERQASWGVKDPKMCFLLPHFLRHVRPGVKIIRTRRRFHDTVHSFQKLWGGMPVGEAVRRLGHYQYALSKNLLTLEGGVEQTDVSYESLCRHPYSELARLAMFLGVEFRAEAVDFIDASLNRHGTLSPRQGDHQAAA